MSIPAAEAFHNIIIIWGGRALGDLQISGMANDIPEAIHS